jgi:hypothetical protein
MRRARFNGLLNDGGEEPVTEGGDNRGNLAFGAALKALGLEKSQN